MSGIIPCPARMRHTQGREGGAGGRKPILHFPSREIEAHVPIMKYFLPFHGSSVIPDGSEPGKTDPPFSHPRRDRTGSTDTASSCRDASPPSSQENPLFHWNFSEGMREFPPPCPPGLPPPLLSFILELCGFFQLF